jgi:hypothetical protein
MKRAHLRAWVGLVLFFCVAGLRAEQGQPAGDGSSGSATATVAAVPRLIKFNGAVRDARGEPLGNVAVRLAFSVYEEQTGGAALWAEAQVVQVDEQGHYAVLLGATRADGLPVELFPAGKARWLGVQVEGRDEDARVLLVSVPYALKAEDAAMLGGRQASDFVLGEQLKEEVRTQVAAQTPGIATQAVEMLVSNPPKAPAIAEGPSTFTCATTGDCVAVTQSSTGRALRTTATSASETVLVQQNGTGYGLRALAPGNVALYGQITSSVGASYGVKGQTTSTTGAGVFGYNLATTGLAYGVLGQTASTSGTALFGRATALTGATIGLRGHSDSTSGTGIMGQATAASGTTTGIVGRVFSVDGTALVVDNTKGGKVLSGQVNGAEMFSVSGSGDVSTSGNVKASGFGVESGNLPFSVDSVGNVKSHDMSVNGNLNVDGSTNAFGSLEAHSGLVTNSISTYGGGPLAITTGNLQLDGGLSMPSGVLTAGSVDITGTLSAQNLNVSGTKNFKIDHPLDPANKYLYHASIESSEVMNLYTGSAVLDAKGEAWVSLPEWFEALNSDFRYQLTAIGRPQPRLYIAQEISANRFRIAGGKSGAKVSWQVTGIRQDAYARAHRIRVEEEKPAAAKGFYLHPELFGQPATRGIQWAGRADEAKPRQKEVEKTLATTAQGGN